MRRLHAIAFAILVALGALLLPVQALAEDYDLILVGTQVTSDNAADIFGDGTASFDPNTNTLTLDGLVATAGYNDSTLEMLHAETPNLTIVLNGENAFVSKRARCLFSRGNLTITGDGSLSANGGYDITLNAENAMAICTFGVLTFDEGFTGTVIANGGATFDLSWAIVASKGYDQRNGTVIATGGPAEHTAGICITTGTVSVSGGLLVAQGGNSKGITAVGLSEGITGNGGLTCTFTGGAAVVRAGTVNGSMVSVNRRAFRGPSPVVGDNMRVVASVGYVDGTFTDTDPTSTATTAVVIADESYVDTDVLDPLAHNTNLASNVCHVTTDGSSFGSDVTMDELTLNMNGHNALFVNLCDTTSENAGLMGYVMNADAAHIVGAGTFAAIGGVSTGAGSSTAGLYVSGLLDVDGAKVVGAGALGGGDAKGVACNGAIVKNGSLVGSGGVGGDGFTSIGIDARSNAVSAYETSYVLGVGGRSGLNCLGIEGNGVSYDNASVVGVGGMLTTGASDQVSCGIHGEAISYGGVTCGLGGYTYNPNRYSLGAITGNSYRGGKVVSLGGPGFVYSIGILRRNESPAIQGELVLAGRWRAIYYTSSKVVYADYLVATGYTNFEGTEGKQSIESGATVSSCERVVVSGKYPLYVAGVQVTIDNADDLTVIDGVSVAEDGYARYNPSTKTLELKDATIVNPLTPVDGITDGLTIEDRLTIAVKGECTVCGAPDSYGTCSIWFGSTPLTITLVDGASFDVASPELGDAAWVSAINGRGPLAVNGKGTMNVQAPAATELGTSYAIELDGDLTVADQVTVYAASALEDGSMMPRNTGALLLRGDAATITLSDEARFEMGGVEHGIAVDTTLADGDTFDLHVIAEPGWSGRFMVASVNNLPLADVTSESADGTNATFHRSWDTTGLLVYADPSDLGTEWGGAHYTFDEFASNMGFSLDPATAFPVSLGTTEGGSYGTEGLQPSDYEDMRVSANINVMAGNAFSIVATADEGYRFVGWYVGVEGESGFIEDHTDELVSFNATYTFTPTAYVPLQAVFERIAYTVSFAPGEGAGSMEPVVVEYGSTYKLPTCGFTAPKGKTFDRWDVGAVGATIEVTGDMTVTAKWKDDVQLIPIYRMYNTKTSEHLWTKSKKEYDSCGKGSYVDWRQENVAWYSPDLKAPASYAASNQGSYVYVWRLYDKGRTGDHIYLVYGSEMRQYLANGWVVDKGAGFWTLKKGATISGRKTIPIYRAYNPKLKRGKHHYTPSKVEYDSICKNHGWKPEGVKFYVVKK